MRNLIFIFLAISLIQCGGGSASSGGGDNGGGGTGGGDNGSNNGGNNGGTSSGSNGSGENTGFPLIEPDPNYLGDQIEFDGETFTFKTDQDDTLSIKSTGKKGMVYQFDNPSSQKGNKFYVMAMSNKDAMISSTIVGDGEKFGADSLYGVDGVWMEKAGFTTQRYMGVYQSMDKNGAVHPNTSMVVDLDLENIYQSVGYDLSGNHNVSIHFTQIDENKLYGTISDYNGYNHSSIFGLFGANGDTIAGGYSYELGSGILLATK